MSSQDSQLSQFADIILNESSSQTQNEEDCNALSIIPETNDGSDELPPPNDNSADDHSSQIEDQNMLGKQNVEMLASPNALSQQGSTFDMLTFAGENILGESHQSVDDVETESTAENTITTSSSKSIRKQKGSISKKTMATSRSTHLWNEQNLDKIGEMSQYHNSFFSGNSTLPVFTCPLDSFVNPSTRTEGEVTKTVFLNGDIRLVTIFFCITDNAISS